MGIRLGNFSPLLIFGILLGFPFQNNAQFYDDTGQFYDLGVYNTVSTFVFVTGASVCFYDFNHDGWDDITLTGVDSTYSSQAPIFLVNNQGTLEHADFSIPTATNAHTAGLIWFDFDNDGDSDMLVTNQDGRIELWENDGAFNFSNIAFSAGIPQFLADHAGVCAGDYDHDGYLDLYISNYYGGLSEGFEFESGLYRNNGDGTFSNVTQSAGVYLAPHPALQPVWVDVNHDGWEDLFICVDRTPWPNELFVNNGDGTFNRVTETSGVNTYMDGMSSTVGDWENDGDLDIYVTNSPIDDGNAFYVNDGQGNFFDAALQLNVEVMISGWGALWLDYDNDMWQDLLVSTMWEFEGIQAFVNHSGDSLVLDQLWPNDNSLVTETYGLAAGDLNNDGYFDFVSNNRNLQNARLMVNDGGDHHFLSVTLEGTIANRDGIGTWIHCYAGGMHQVRYTHCGENYFGQDSRKEIFGLGDVATVDSLVLEWNSGTREVYLNPAIDTHHYFIEGESFSQPFALSYEGDLFLCAGESLTLDAGEYESYLWSTGDTSQTIVVSDPGTYSVEVVNAFGLTVNAIPVEVVTAPETSLSIIAEDIQCAGLANGQITVELTGAELDSIWWNNGDTLPQIDNLETGVYSFTGLDTFGCAFSGEAAIDEPAPLFGQAEATDALCYDEASGSVTIELLGGTPPYTPDWQDLDPDALMPGDYTITVLDNNGCALDLSFQVDAPDSLALTIALQNASNGNENGSANLTVAGGVPPYAIDWSNGAIDTLWLSGLAPGDYAVNVMDDNGCTDSLAFSISTNTGIATPGNADIVVFPNPANQRLTIVTGGLTIGEIELYDSLGRLVLRAFHASSSATLNLSTIASGIYFLQFPSRPHQPHIRVVIDR